MAESASPYPVYVGVWTNWSHGKVLGSTLTLSKTDGALLIAFIAFFVTLIGSQLWRILCFVLHGIFSANSSQDVLHNQRQAVLRNSATPLSSIWILIQMLQAWSKPESHHGKARPLRKLLPLMLATLLIAVALVAATGLSSRISQGTEVLIQGSDCGRLRIFQQDTATVLLANSRDTREIVQASDYAQRCYQSTSSSSECNTFSRPSLPMTITTNASCPFDESLCLSQDSNIILDSGLMDSHADLGLNWPPEERFQLQHKLHCAPLVTEGFRTDYEYENRTFIRYQYGSLSTMPSPCNCSLAISTTSIENIDLGFTSPFLEPDQGTPLITTYTAYLNETIVPEYSNSLPIPQLDRHHGDLTLVFLVSNGMTFAEKSDDLWYRATTPFSRGDLGEDVVLYRPDEPAWPMGCVAQEQLCKDGTCTGLGSSLDSQSSLSEDYLGLNSTFLGAGYYFNLQTNLHDILMSLGPRALEGTHKGSGYQVGPSQNEWQKDVAHWFATFLARMQFALTDVAAGPDVEGFPGLEEHIVRAPENETQRFCHSQKIQSTAYTSFNFFWLLFIFVAGGLIVLISASMEWIASALQKWMPKTFDNEYRPLEWRANHFLHLQRLAHEGLGARDWQEGAWDIPIATTETSLAVLAEDKGLPRFVCRSDYSSSFEAASEKSEGRLDRDDEVVSAGGKTQVSLDENRVSRITDASQSGKAIQIVAETQC